MKALIKYTRCGIFVGLVMLVILLSRGYEKRAPYSGSNSVFKRIVENSDDFQREMGYFSESMATAMHLSANEITKADGFVWHIEGYDISVRAFPWNGWEHILIATPAGVDGRRAGYSNTYVNLPTSWHYKQEGTATEILPPLPVQAEIIETLKQITSKGART